MLSVIRLTLILAKIYLNKLSLSITNTTIGYLISMPMPSCNTIVLHNFTLTLKEANVDHFIIHSVV